MILALVVWGNLVGALASAESAGQRLRAGDQVQIRVHDNPDLDLAQRIPDQGRISMPLIGEVQFSGLSPETIAKDIKARLEDGFLRRADVTVSVIEALRAVYVLGAVRTPGSVSVGAAPMTALQAIAASGGFTDNADRAGARVMRPNATATGGKEALSVPAGDDPAALATDPILQPGDTIVVPRRDRIYVLGQVVRPGALEVPAQGALTAGRAIAQAGGFDRFARQGEALLLRPGSKPITINLEKILAGTAEDVALKPGDSLVVPESRF